MKTQVNIIYDGNCPLCRQYTHFYRIRDAIGIVELIDARQNPILVDTLFQNGFNLDQGFIVKVAEQYYHGADALHILALMGTSSSLFNKFNYHVFRYKVLAKALYPVLRFGRNILLRLLKKRKIHSTSYLE